MGMDGVSSRVIGSGIEVHRRFELGLLESVSEQCLSHGRSRNGIVDQRQLEWPVQLKDVRLDCGDRFDMLIANQRIVELKCVDEIKRIHEARLSTDMKPARVEPVALFIVVVGGFQTGVGFERQLAVVLTILHRSTPCKRPVRLLTHSGSPRR